MLALFLMLSMALTGPTGGLSDDDPLQLVMDEMAAAECCRFDFISILESDVFDTIDTTVGTALIASDSRYDILLGPDRYLRTGEILYSYSGENEQVTLERVGGSSAQDETIRFITQLDRYYLIHPEDGHYRLVSKPESESNLPAKITLTLTESGELGRLEYIDDNGDTNWIVINESLFRLACDSTAFAPDFPESTELIKLY